MAGRLLKAGYPLTVFNRSPQKSKSLVDQGAKPASTPKELAGAAEIIIMMLSDDSAVRQVIEGREGAFAGAHPGTIFVDCGTISVKTTQDLASQAENSGFHWLDAPVLGGPAAAESGDLPFVVGGEKEILEKVGDTLKVLGKKITWMGQSGMGQAAKQVHNMVAGIFLEAYGEAIHLGEKWGLTRKQILEVLSQGAVNSPLLGYKISKYETDKFDPSFALALMSKDLELAQKAGTELGLSLSVLKRVSDIFAEAKANGLGEEDSSAIIKAL
ncbi:MAG: 3-hydroxyisobutyrate dehydrogenase [Parcubacteria group bacterium GW2011_GWA2_52_8]|nr:MAG: 3-hydroxyisobutyrate dehydrogenase [Parcubacteria group bacterium GW2011_GWA2_52_8]